MKLIPSRNLIDRNRGAAGRDGGPARPPHAGPAAPHGGHPRGHGPGERWPPHGSRHGGRPRCARRLKDGKGSTVMSEYGDSQEIFTDSDVEHEGTEDFRKADQVAVATSQRTEYFGLSPSY